MIGERAVSSGRRARSTRNPVPAPGRGSARRECRRDARAPRRSGRRAAAASQDRQVPRRRAAGHGESRRVRPRSRPCGRRSISPRAASATSSTRWASHPRSSTGSAPSAGAGVPIWRSSWIRSCRPRPLRPGAAQRRCPAGADRGGRRRPSVRRRTARRRSGWSPSAARSPGAPPARRAAPRRRQLRARTTPPPCATRRRPSAWPRSRPPRSSARPACPAPSSASARPRPRATRRTSTGITEMRAGVFMIGDLFQAGVGSCAVDDIALTVLATVIGHQRDKGWIITDAGWMALSRDRGTAARRSTRAMAWSATWRAGPYRT